jgi:hypothetical protein
MNARPGLPCLVFCLLASVSCAGRQPAVQPAQSTAASWIELADGLRVDRVSRTVEVRAWVCLDRGWLEQVLCLPGTREHESLMVTDVKPSSIHAALLLIGLEPEQPGRWVDRDGEIMLTPPRGDSVSVVVRYDDVDSSACVQRPVSDWIADVATTRPHPDVPWIFGGSLTHDDIESGSTYAADYSGSIIGLVTFGDEVLGAVDVIPDAEAVHAPEWVVRYEVMPPVGTAVMVLLSPDGGHSAGF